VELGSRANLRCVVDDRAHSPSDIPAAGGRSVACGDVTNLFIELKRDVLSGRLVDHG
jgi:hypothetical protein